MFVDIKLFEPFAEGEDFDVVCLCELHDAVLVAEGRHPLAPRDDVDRSDRSQNPSEDEQDSPPRERPALERKVSLSDTLASRGITLGHDDIGQHGMLSPRRPSTRDACVGDDGELLPGEVMPALRIPKKTPSVSVIADEDEETVRIV